MHNLLLRRQLHHQLLLTMSEYSNLTRAQQILLAIGVPETKVFFGHKLGKSETNTKRGPGRKHKQGRKEANPA